MAPRTAPSPAPTASPRARLPSMRPKMRPSPAPTAMVTPIPPDAPGLPGPASFVGWPPLAPPCSRTCSNRHALPAPSGMACGVAEMSLTTGPARARGSCSRQRRALVARPSRRRVRPFSSRAAGHVSRQQHMSAILARWTTLLPNAYARKRPVQHRSGAPGLDRTADTRFRKHHWRVLHEAFRVQRCCIVQGFDRARYLGRLQA